MALSEAVPTFAERYKVTEDAIYKDWVKREKWDIITVDPNQVVQDCANELDEVRSRLWNEAKDALTEGARIKALAKLSDIIFRKLEVYQALGIVVNPHDLRQPTEAEIEALHKFVVEVAGENVHDQTVLVKDLIVAQRSGRGPREIIKEAEAKKAETTITPYERKEADYKEKEKELDEIDAKLADLKSSDEQPQPVGGDSKIPRFDKYDFDERFPTNNKRRPQTLDSP
jgi:hypothetical protein